MREKRKTVDRILTIVLWLLIVANAVPLLWYGTRAFVADRFVIKGESMEPTLHTGEGVWVNKLLMGARIYTKFDFEDSPELHCFRMPGLRKLRVGDVAVFNYPYGRGGDTIAFKINYVYCKRCWGAPGDTVRIVDGRLETETAETVARHPSHGSNLFSSLAQRMQQTPDSVLLRMRMLRAGQFAGERDNWTTKDFGPIVVPRKGMTIALDSINRKHYERVIRWETGVTVGEITHSNSQNYTVRQDWYFFVGDNVTNSRDSRFFGFVPADFVIGIVPKGKR
jgi:signal peptidase I, bacterial type